MGKSAESQLDQHPSLPSKTTERAAKPSFKNHYFSTRRKRLTSTLSQTLKDDGMEVEEHHSQKEVRVPLSEVVSDCVRRWFTDTLKEAKAGDINMQVLVGQMYFNGYGISKDAQKGRLWMSRASRVRSSVWKVSHKRPGYNASDSDSDSDELVGEP